MAPGPKRKRPERGYSQDDQRPSPHRPEQLRMANGPSHPHQQQHSPRGGGPNRRQSRNNGRGGAPSVPQSPTVSHSPATAMSPPVSAAPAGRRPPSAPSTPAPPAPPKPQPQSHPQVPRPPPTRKVPESNEYLTSARVSQWSSEARDAVVQAAMDAQRNAQLLSLAVIFHEIIEAAMDNSMSPEELGSMVREIVSGPVSEEVDTVSLFLDTLSSLTTDKDKQALVRNLLVATEIEASRMRNELEVELLDTLGLVRNTFSRVAVRKATHALYRQSNYNLLREETEGYSKLMTLYFTTVNSESPNREVVSETYTRVNALIGAFDLDIGRVLDVTLDVFANLIVKHYRFFVKFLRLSAWWPELRGFEGVEWSEPDVATLPLWAEPTFKLSNYTEIEKEQQQQSRETRDRAFWTRISDLGERNGIHAYFELGARRIVSNNRQSSINLPSDGIPLSKQQAARKWADDWMTETGTMPPSGNDVAAQLLGFKLRFYASDTRDPSDFLPDNLIYLAALLIKIGFISILDLYPHLYPAEENMSAHKEALLKAKKEREQREQGGVANALTMAGALPDEGPHGLPAVTRLREAASKSQSERSTPAKSDEPAEKKPSLPEPADQKYQLLKSLLCIGALPEALFILGRHPWLLEVYPDLAEYIIRIGHHSLSKVYEATKPSAAGELTVAGKGSGSRSTSRPSDFVPRRVLRWAKPDQKDAADGGIDYKFYWEDWIDNVPVCQEVDDVIKLCTTLLGLLGAECGQDVELLTKIIRIGRKSLADDASAQNRKRWVDFSSTFIAPALSYTGQNPGVINEAWSLFKNFDTATRYSIYNHWFNSTKPSSIRSVFEKVRKDTNYILSRISAQNTKEYGRKLAKISYASPGAVFRITTKRLINYSNMIDTMVECVRYLTLLGYDCLVWAVVTYLLSPDKGDMKDNGMVSADWLKHIATFIAKACQKNKLIDPTPFLQLTAHQMIQPAGDLFMQDVLEQMCEHMGSIKQTTPTTSETAVLYQCAGPVLRTSHFLNVFKEDRSRAETSAKRLVKCLTDTGLAPQILIAMAQHIDAFIYREDQEDAPDKVVLYGMDKLRQNMLQFLELLRTSTKVDDFDSMIPGPIEMISEFNVRPHLALTIARTSIAHKFNAARKQYRLPSPKPVPQSNGDVAMTDAEESTVDKTNGLVAVSDKEDIASGMKRIDIEMKESTTVEPGANEDAGGNGAVANRATNLEIENMAKRLKEEAPEEFGDNPCVAFVVTFFAMHLGDIDGAGINQQYDASIARIKPRLPKPNTRRETDDMRRANLETSKLQLEQAETTKARAVLHQDLQREMWQWFDNIPMTGAQSDAVHMMLLQDCFLPRASQSVEDAQFAAAMLKFMHTQGVPGFRTIKVLDHLFNANKLVCLLSLFSQNEANTFGRFMNGILRELERWHENKDDAYAKSAVGIHKDLPGFGKRFDSDRNPTDHLSYDEYCHLLYKWHKILFTAIKHCLSSGDFQQIRNSLCVLQAVKNIFPKVKSMATELSNIVDPMQKDERQDLQTQARSSMALFKGGKTISEYKFRNLEEPKPAPGETRDEEASQTPQPPDSAPLRLNAGAPSFRPTSDTNGVRDQSAAASNDANSQQSKSEPSAAKQSAQAEVAKAQDNRGHTPLSGTPAQSSQHPVMPARPDNRNTPQPANRTSHALPNRPDSQPPRNRPSDRPVLDRQTDSAPHGRYDSRGTSSDYGRLERPVDSTGRLREASPGRRSRVVPDGRTPERMPPSGDHRDWPARDYDDRNMRAPPRDVRGPPTRNPQAWEARDSRDVRDNRDYRERHESRGQGGPPVMEPRRMHSNSALGQDHGQHRRDMPPHPHPHHASDRGEHAPSRPSPTPTSPAGEGPTVNPARAALINDQLEQHERPMPPRPERDNRREQRGSRPQSPHRESGPRSDDRRTNDRPPSGYHIRHEPSRDLREERAMPAAQQSSGRERRDDSTVGTPTGPRGGRNEQQAPGASREMFQPPSRSQRGSGYQAQDPNYGRLNQPSESAPPSGPRSESHLGDRVTGPNVLTTTGERPQQQQQQQQQPPAAAAAAAAPAQQTGIHPSRLENIQRPGVGPSSQSSMPNAPSGPRGSGRGPQGPPLSSPVSRGPPTGPAAADRGPRSNDRRNQLGAINNTLNQAVPPPERSSENLTTQQQNPPVRGRGSTRANGMTESSSAMTNSMPPPHGATTNSRSDSSHHRNNRSEFNQGRPDFVPQDDGKQESRSHHGRRSERSGRERSRSPDRSDRRPDERSTRNGPSDRPPHVEGGEDRERNGRDKRGGERESSSRRERDGERSSRGEPREGSGRSHRSSREDGRMSGRDERDRRSRGGPGGSSATNADDGRKRGREAQDQGQGHVDPKRRR